MKTKLFLLSALFGCVASSASFAMTKVEHTTQKDMISGDYKVSRDKCNSLKANAKDICVAEAKGVQKVANAELKAAYEPSVRHTEMVATAKGDAVYDTAKEKCDESQGNAKAVCRAEAKAVHVKATDEARVVRVKAESDKLNTGVRNDANKDEKEANYKVAVQKCESMSGASKDTCISQAKTTYDMK